MKKTKTKTQRKKVEKKDLHLEKDMRSKMSILSKMISKIK